MYIVEILTSFLVEELYNNLLILHGIYNSQLDFEPIRYPISRGRDSEEETPSEASS